MTACTLQSGGLVCGAVPARPYLQGRRCTSHTPARLAGRPDLTADPDRTLAALQARFAQGPASPAARRDIPAKEIPADVTPAPSCPGCHLHPRAHAPNCPMGPRARFSMAADGSMLGTAKRGPE